MNTVTLPRSVVEQALEALDESYADTRQGRALADALRAALEQPQVEQKPVAEVTVSHVLPDLEGRCTAEIASRERLPVGAELFIHPQNINCKSNQARLATLWGYVKEQPKREPMPPQADTPLTQEQLTIFKYGWKCAESAHGIRGKA